MISDIDEQTIDIDWYRVDSEGYIANFSTGGGCGFLPKSIKLSDRYLDFLPTFFKKATPVQGNGVVSARLMSHHIQPFCSEERKDLFFESYLDAASKGLYAYHFKGNGSGDEVFGYYTVASPSMPMHVSEVPPDIQKVLERTRFHGEFRTADTIRLNEIE